MNIHTLSARAAAALVATVAGAASWSHIASVAAGAGDGGEHRECGQRDGDQLVIHGQLWAQRRHSPWITRS